MLKSKLLINYEKLNENKQQLQKIKGKTGFNLNDLKGLNDNADWLIQNEEDKIKELIVRMSKTDDLIELNLFNQYKEINFENDDAIKKLFLIYHSVEWESPISIASVLNTLRKVDVIESNIGKSVLEFDLFEANQAIIELFAGREYYKLRNQINLLSLYQEFYSNQISNNKSWNHYNNIEVLREVISEEAKEYSLSQEHFITLCNLMPNIQDSIVPLLIFEGVSLSKKDEMDEVRYLRFTDLNDNKLRITGNGKNERNNQRVIEVTSEVADLIRDAINQDSIVKKIGFEETLVELQSTRFILRPSVNARRKINTGEHPDILSYRGAYSRINLCKEAMNQVAYEINFTPKAIEKYGKVFYINKFIQEGYSDVEAIIKTLKRFGDWYHEPEGSGRLPQNSQLINRLRRVWKVYQ